MDGDEGDPLEMVEDDDDDGDDGDNEVVVVASVDSSFVADEAPVVSLDDGDVDMAELVAGTKDTPFNPKLIRMPSYSNSLCNLLSVLQIKTDLTKSGSAVCRYRVNLHMLILNTI